MKASRNPQLALRLDANSPDPATRWHDGTAIPYLGGALTLRIGTQHKDAVREGNELHLPLPPLATPRQIQDRAEAWLREEARGLLNHAITRKSVLAGRRAPKLVLSFSARGHWAEVQDRNELRCNWRLIEQPTEVIDLVIARAVAALPPDEGGFDLFGALSV